MLNEVVYFQMPVVRLGPLRGARENTNMAHELTVVGIFRAFSGALSALSLLAPFLGRCHSHLACKEAEARKLQGLSQGGAAGHAGDGVESMPSDTKAHAFPSRTAFLSVWPGPPHASLGQCWWNSTSFLDAPDPQNLLMGALPGNTPGRSAPWGCCTHQVCNPLSWPGALTSPWRPDVFPFLSLCLLSAGMGLRSRPIRAGRPTPPEQGSDLSDWVGALRHGVRYGSGVSPRLQPVLPSSLCQPPDPLGRSF